MSTSLAVWAVGEQQNMSLPIDVDVAHECEVSPLPVHVVLGSNMPNSVKERGKLHSKKYLSVTLFTTCKSMARPRKQVAIYAVLLKSA